MLVLKRIRSKESVFQVLDSFGFKLIDKNKSMFEKNGKQYTLNYWRENDWYMITDIFLNVVS